MEATRMVRVVSARDAFEARILAARLGAEGIVWELQGNVDGPYPVGVVHVLVEVGEADVARELLAMELEPEGDHDDVLPAPRRWPAAVAVALVVLMGVARVAALF